MSTLTQSWAFKTIRSAVLTVLAAIGLLVIYLVNAGLMAVVIYWGHMLGINIETEMRRRAFDHLQRLSFSYFDKVRTGKLVARVTRDLEEIGEAIEELPFRPGPPLRRTCRRWRASIRRAASCRIAAAGST